MVTAQVSTMIGHETHARTLRSIQDAVEAIGSASTLSLSLVATVLAAAHGILPAAASLRLQRLVNNPKLDLEERGYAYVRSVIGERRELLLSMDWTEFDADDHSTLCVSRITDHGRATPLWWMTGRCADLEPGARMDLEDTLVLRLRSVLPADVKVRILCDRGFTDQERFELWDRMGWGYIVRTRGTIWITDANGTMQRAAQWLHPEGRAVRLANARITLDQQPIGSFVAVQQKGMKDAWYLICDAGIATAKEAIALYGRRFTMEETFRDHQDPRFGMGLDHLRIEDPQRRDRMLLLAAMAHAVLTLLGAAGEACKLDRGLHKNGGVSSGMKRIYSLYRQGCMWLELLPTLRDDRKVLLIAAFERILRKHHALTELLGIL